MKDVSFEPMSVGRILDYTFKIYKDNFLRFMAIVAAVVIPVQLVIILSQQIMYADLFRDRDAAPPVIVEEQTEYEYESPGGGQPASGSEEYIYEENTGPNPITLIVGSVGTFIGLFLMIISNKLAQGALTHNVSQYYLGETATVGQAYRYVLKRLLRLLGAAILVGLIVFAGLLLFVVPGIIFGLWYALVVPIILVEDCGVSAALTRSKKLVAGNLGKVFGLGFLVLVISWIIQVPFQAIGQVAILLLTHISPLLGTLIAQISQLIGEIIITPIAAAAYILLYYDLRIRKEAFDLEMLAEKVHEQNVQTDETAIQ